MLESGANTCQTNLNVQPVPAPAAGVPVQDLASQVGQLLYALSLSTLNCTCPNRQNCEIFKLAVRLGQLLARQLAQGAAAAQFMGVP